MPRPLASPFAHLRLALAAAAALAGLSGAESGVAPTITQQPATQTVKRLGTVTFEVKATGTPPLTYRWYRGGSTWPDWTRSSLRLEGLTENDVGHYTVTVSNSAGTVISQSAALRVEGAAPPPPVTGASNAPVKRALESEREAKARSGFASDTEYVEPGKPLRLGASSDGTPPLRFQWTRNGQPLPGATQARLEISAVKAGDAGKYVCIVSNAAGSRESPPVMVIVGKKP